jgi:acyl-[acyl-carrier-protein]-phospholipid O-acyltransferase/long-chain-fatty-acid--[acyl-carrier-protein] ligase
MTGGQLADRFSKRTVTIGVKVFEIAVMLFVLAAFRPGASSAGMAGVFLMGVHSAIFGPSKYGLLPGAAPREDLSWGNGIIEMGTFARDHRGDRPPPASCYAGLRGAARTLSGGRAPRARGIGLATSLGISRVPAASPRASACTLNVRRRLRRPDAPDRTRPRARPRRPRQRLVHVHRVPHAAEHGPLRDGHPPVSETALRGSCLAALGIGIGIGSVVAGILSGGKIEYGLVPLGSMG